MTSIWSVLVNDLRALRRNMCSSVLRWMERYIVQDYYGLVDFFCLLILLLKEEIESLQL